MCSVPKIPRGGWEFTAIYEMDGQGKAQFLCEQESRTVIVILMATLASIDLMSPP